jgi:hypothetical protein
MDGLINLIIIIGFLGAIILWIMAMNRAVSDDVHFKLVPIWKTKREWFKSSGYQLYMGAHITLGIAIVSNVIYRWFLT